MPFFLLLSMAFAALSCVGDDQSVAVILGKALRCRLLSPPHDFCTSPRFVDILDQRGPEEYERD
jgi:hypothetical protein